MITPLQALYQEYLDNRSAQGKDTATVKEASMNAYCIGFTEGENTGDSVDGIKKSITPTKPCKNKRS